MAFPCVCDVTIASRERESLLAQTLNNFMRK